MVTAKTLKPMYFSNSFSNCFSWQNFFSSIINCWQADRINTPAFKKPSNDLAPLPPWSWVGREVWAWAWAGGEASEGAGEVTMPGLRGACLPHQLRGGVGRVPHAPITLFFFLVTGLAAAHLQLQIQAACEIMNSLRADCETQARYQRTHIQGSVTH